MPLRWNIDIQPAVINAYRPAIMPGESYEFSEQQIEDGIGGLWSETDPKESLSFLPSRGERATTTAGLGDWPTTDLPDGEADTTATTDTGADAGEKE